jgi:hypothetical protein
MKSLAYNLLGNVPDAEDAVQEAFVRAYRSRDAFRHVAEQVVRKTLHARPVRGKEGLEGGEIDRQAVPVTLVNRTLDAWAAQSVGWTPGPVAAPRKEFCRRNPVETACFDQDMGRDRTL